MGFCRVLFVGLLEFSLEGGGSEGLLEGGWLLDGMGTGDGNG